jgi:hypothetical protein
MVIIPSVLLQKLKEKQAQLRKEIIVNNSRNSWLKIEIICGAEGCDEENKSFSELWELFY